MSSSPAPTWEVPASQERGPASSARCAAHPSALADALGILQVVDARTVDIQEAEVWLADAVRLAVAVDERAAAVELAAYAETLPSQDDIPHRKGAALHCRGLLDADPGLLFDAADCYTAASRPFPRAQALEAAAALLAERGEVASAKVPCISAMDGYVALGAAWDLTRARARFRRYGLRQPTRRRKRPATGWEALTPAEARVAELVAQGLSNPEIAKELVVARPTVGYHVTKVLAKLQVRSRIDVARAAAVRSQQAAP